MFTLLVAFALAVNGPLVGMSLDQALKQLPARRVLGPSTFSAYSRAADLKNGVWLYSIFGVLAALSAMAVALTAMGEPGLSDFERFSAYAAGILSVAHSLTTARAAPINFGQKRIGIEDGERLGLLFNRFERWHWARCVLQVFAFLALLASRSAA
jgi:hypothetical protein